MNLAICELVIWRSGDLVIDDLGDLGDLGDRSGDLLARLDGQLGADQRADAGGERGFMEARRAGDAVAIEQRHARDSRASRRDRRAFPGNDAARRKLKAEEV